MNPLLSLSLICTALLVFSPQVFSFAVSPAPGAVNILNITAFNNISPHPLYTHARITALAFQHALTSFANDILSKHEPSQRAKILNAIEELRLDLEIDGDRTLDVDFVENIDSMNSTFPRHIVFSIRRALFEFVTSNEGVDHSPVTDYHSEYHFDAERIQQANARLATRVELAIYSLGDGKGLGTGDTRRDLVYGRILLGQSMHSMQDFYSHSSWSEIALVQAGVDPADLKLANYRFNLSATKPIAQSGFSASSLSDSLSKEELSKLATLKPHGELGVRGAKFLVAPANMSTCVDCDRGLNCTFNLDRHALERGYLTTGYYEGRRMERIEGWRLIRKPRVPGVVKCSHGSQSDHSAFNVSGRGGISKDMSLTSMVATSGPRAGQRIALAPHAHLHAIAARLALEECIATFARVRKAIGDQSFAELLGVPTPRLFDQILSGTAADASGPPSDAIDESSFPSFLRNIQLQDSDGISIFFNQLSAIALGFCVALFGMIVCILLVRRGRGRLSRSRTRSSSGSRARWRRLETHEP